MDHIQSDLVRWLHLSVSLLRVRKLRHIGVSGSGHDHPARKESEPWLPALDICVNSLLQIVGRA